MFRLQKKIKAMKEEANGTTQGGPYSKLTDKELLSLYEEARKRRNIFFALVFMIWLLFISYLFILAPGCENVPSTSRNWSTASGYVTTYRSKCPDYPFGLAITGFLVGLPITFLVSTKYDK